MRPRYLLISGDDQSNRPELLNRLLSRTNLRPALAGPPLAVLVNEDCPCLPIADGGCVIGTLFHRHGRAASITSLDPADAQAILESGGDRLLSSFWGGYVAAVPDRGSLRIMRDPSAALPCYFARGAGYVAFASDAELLVESRLADIELDWEALAAHFFAAGVPTPATAVRGICELLPGFAIKLRDVEKQVPCWSPWDHVHEHASDDALAAEQLARTVKHCVRSWNSLDGHLLASVSGGLDSSIVAAGLADAGAEATCLTMYGADPNGDERQFARALCNHLGLRLIEREYRIEDIDLTETLGAHLPRPSDRTHALAYERVHFEVGSEVNATAFITGNGGDSVFGYSQSAAAVADRYLTEGAGAGVLETVRDVSLQTGCGFLKAAASALRICRGARGYRCRPDPLFLNPELVIELKSAPIDHPWLQAPSDALPGKSAHVASILRMQQCLEPGRSRYLPVLNPLMSQPILEFCLSVPSWKWRTGGRDRSLARRAFSDDLPPAIVRRRVKGGPDGFAAQVLDNFRESISERLLDGQLAGHGIIDRTTVEEALREQRPSAGEHRARILELVAAEAWIDSWSARRRALENERPVSVTAA